jgi:phage repressor protein C with HTH and peptisase S24 domain
MWESELERLRKLQAARLREARKMRGYKSASEAAKRFGWSSAYISHENGTRGIGRMYREYAKKFKVNPPWLLGHSEERDSIVRGINVVADAAIGTWHEGAGGGHRDSRRNAAPRNVGIPTRQNHDDDERFAVRMADASMNKVLAQGAFAILVPADEHTNFRLGDIVYVERIRDGMTELSLRRVSAINATSMRLSAHSVDPKFRQELTFPTPKDTEKVRIVGRMIGKYEDYDPH